MFRVHCVCCSSLQYLYTYEFHLTISSFGSGRAENDEEEAAPEHTRSTRDVRESEKTRRTHIDTRTPSCGSTSSVSRANCQKSVRTHKYKWNASNEQRMSRSARVCVRIGSVCPPLLRYLVPEQRRVLNAIERNVVNVRGPVHVCMRVQMNMPDCPCVRRGHRIA